MFVLPEDLSALAVADIQALLAEAREEAGGITSLLSTDEAASADLDRLEYLADGIDALNAALAALETPAVEEVVEVEAELAAEEAVEVETPVSDEDRAAALAARFAVTDAVEEIEEPVSEPVVAAAQPVKNPVGAPKGGLPKASTKNSALIAAANLNGVASGKSWDGMGEAIPHLLSAWDGLRGASDGTKTGVFSVVENVDPKLVANGRNDQDVINYAVNQKRFADKGGLLAAGGWCAPPEQKYDICDLAGLDGILDLPGVSVPRGSVSYFRDLRYNDVCALASTAFGSYTNAELEALPPLVKPCVEIPCVDPVTFTLGVETFCIRAGVLQRRAFPELVEAWVRQALICHAHYINAQNIADIVALASVNTVVIPGSFSALASFVGALDLQAQDIRFDHGMTENEVIEGFAPWWLLGTLRSDASRRAFDADWNLTKAEVNSLLASRNIRLQWVKDYIDAPFQGAGPVTAWPTAANVVLYPAGAYLLASDPIIRVGALQDSTLLQTNREQILFVESSRGILPACGDGRVVTLDLCNDGTSGGFNPDATGGTCPLA